MKYLHQQIYLFYSNNIINQLESDVNIDASTSKQTYSTMMSDIPQVMKSPDSNHSLDNNTRPDGIFNKTICNEII